MRIKSVAGQNGMGENSPFRLETEPPGPEAQEIAELELRETEDRVKQAIEELKKLLRGK